MDATRFPKAEFQGFENNSIEVSQAKALTGRYLIKTGIHNLIKFGPQSEMRGSIIIQGNNNVVELHDGAFIRGDILVKGDNQIVTIGKDTTSVGIYILCQEGCNVSIGSHCMFSREIEIRTTDAHSVIDRASGVRLNSPQSITIGSHVWVGVGAIINKGSVIPNDSIVGAMAFVNRKFYEDGVILAGSPAKVVKRGITWSRKRKESFSRHEMDAWHSDE